MAITPFKINSKDNSKSYEYEFSIFSLVNKKDQYFEFLKSCENAGFNNKNSEFGFFR